MEGCGTRSCGVVMVPDGVMVVGGLRMVSDICVVSV